MKHLALIVTVLGLVDPTCTIQKICTPGYAATVRPASSYTTKLKIKQMKALGLSGDPGEFEEDHFISLEIGGHPTDPRNLWPEPWPEARKKDVVETFLHRCICKHGMPMVKAQKLIYQWPALYTKIKGGVKCEAL